MRIHRLHQVQEAEQVHQRGLAAVVGSTRPAIALSHPIIQLQKMIGNQSFRGMLRSRAVQPKLIINHGRWSPIGAIWTSRERTHLPKSFGRRVWLQPTRSSAAVGTTRQAFCRLTLAAMPKSEQDGGPLVA